MSRPFPKAEYAEDQTLAHTILTTHVLHRGFQTGALLGALGGTALSFRKAASAVASQTHSSAPLADASARPLTMPPSRIARILGTTGRSSLWATGIMAVIMVPFMGTRTKIEWQDRSWRLLENEGQVLCDDFSVAGTVAGGVVAFARERGATQMGKGIRVVGGMGIGNLIGVAGYMVYRYGMKGGDLGRPLGDDK